MQKSKCQLFKFGKDSELQKLASVIKNLQHLNEFEILAKQILHENPEGCFFRFLIYCALAK